MRLGDKIPAGLGVSTVLASMDFEAYSEAGYYWDPDAHKWQREHPNKTGIAAVGAWQYTRHPSTQILCLQYNLKDGVGCRLWRPGMMPPLALFEYIFGGGKIEATNSFFEWCLWFNVAGPVNGWPPLPLKQLRDVAAKSAAFGCPRQLEQAARALDVPVKKDADGKKVMLKLATPQSPTTKSRFTYEAPPLFDSFYDPSKINAPPARLTPEDEPALFQTLYNYCETDVAAEDGVSAACPDLSPFESRVAMADQNINARGAHLDRALINAAISVFRQAEKKYTVELTHLTGGAVQTGNELKKIREWLATNQGVHTDSLDAEHLEALLARDTLPPVARRVLEIRDILSSASIKKLFTMQRFIDADDDRARDLYSYGGANRTTRWAGSDIQTQNLPANGPKTLRCPQCGSYFGAHHPVCPYGCGVLGASVPWSVDTAEACIAAIMTEDLALVEYLWGDPCTAIAGCLRAAFTPAPGNEFICSDFSAIEAVILAELAGEEWRQEVFRTHGKIYEVGASKITGVPLEEFFAHKERTGQHHPYRKKIGKISELASGYQGWTGAWVRFGADKFMTEAEIEDNVKKWRDASPMIVRLWAELESAAKNAVTNPGQVFTYRYISYGMKDNVLYCRLPSGRYIHYHAPMVLPYVDQWGRKKTQLSFMGLDSQTKQWVRIETYGGKICENATQAIGRDFQAAAMVAAEDAGYPVVIHVHDELVCEVKIGTGSIAELERLMSLEQTWAPGWPVKAAGGWRGFRYRKD